jgi:hypothetical protein
MSKVTCVEVKEFSQVKESDQLDNRQLVNQCMAQETVDQIEAS